MPVLGMILQIVYVLLWIYILFLLARLVTEWVQVFARSWEPKGPVLVVLETVYTATDPPLKALRKVIPVLRLGGIALDLSFLVLMIALYILVSIVGGVAAQMMMATGVA